MIPFLVAQLISPPLQNSPIRLPGPEAGQQRSTPQKPSVPLDLEAPPTVPEAQPPQPRPAPPLEGQEIRPDTLGPDPPPPQVNGLTVYTPEEVFRILASCGKTLEPAERLNACAARLTARLVADGYINSRVYTEEKPHPGYLEVIEGRIVELRVRSDDRRLARKVQRLLTPLQGAILHLPMVQKQLQLLKRLTGITNVRGNLSRLGSDPAQGVFTVSLQSAASPWQGEGSISNDGTNGSGEARGLATVVKSGLAIRGDTFLLFGEFDSDRTPSLGAVISSISYTLPIGDQLSFTGSFGFSRRNLIELPDSSEGMIATNQFQGLGQFEWVFQETLTQRWSLFAGFSGNSSKTYLNGKALPDLLPESVRMPKSGYMRFGINGSRLSGSLGWAGSAFMLQGIAAATPQQQRKELALAGIDPGAATALGGLVSVGWSFAPSWQLNLRAAGQWSFSPLTSPMQFTVGSDAGLRGLPGQLISGDSGWLGTAETSWTFWQNNANALQLVPFIGMGGVQTTLNGVTLSDTVGSGGLLARWLVGDVWQLELGWVQQFETGNNVGAWTDWALGKGLYAQVIYRF